MRFLRYVLPFVVTTFGVAASLQAVDDEGSYSSTTAAQQRDFDALQEFIKTKRAISIQDKGGNLSFSGDIRTEWYFMKAKTGSRYQRGWKSRKLFPNSFTKKELKAMRPMKYESEARRLAYKATRNRMEPPYPTNEFDIESNLIFDYVADRGWGTVRLQFSNPAGIKEHNRSNFTNLRDSRKMMYGSGKTGNIALRKCFAGYNIWERGTSRFDLEIGRRRLYDVFDSRVQFGSYFDGLLARFSGSWEGVTDYALKASAFVVDYTVEHFGYIGELGLLNLGDTGFDLKYSLVHWDRSGKNRYNKKHPEGVRFVNSQITAAYNFSPDVVSMKTVLYGAYVHNHKAPKTRFTRNKRKDDAFYLGARVGESVRKGDWSLDFCYQWVQAQAVSERDVTDINRDNPRAISMYNRRSGGFANYKGWRLEGFYSLTDNWTLNAHFDRIHEEDRGLGGKHRSFKFYLATVFGF